MSTAPGPARLVELAVTDLGIIADLRLLLAPGMTALTGETGAGKTMVLGAIELLLGGRADAGVVRPGATEAVVEGRFLVQDDEVVITRENPQIYLHGRILKVPTHLVGSYQLVITDTEYALFDVRDGVEAICFPLPLATTATKRTLPFWQVHGARIRDARPGWTQKHQVYEAEHHPGA